MLLLSGSPSSCVLQTHPGVQLLPDLVSEGNSSPQAGKNLGWGKELPSSTVRSRQDTGGTWGLYYKVP